jgi:hypothetical protein
MSENILDPNNKLHTPLEKDFEGLKVEVSKFDISIPPSSVINYGNDEITKDHLNEYLNNFPLYKEAEKCRVIYNEKQQELMKYFAGQQIKMKQKIEELQTLAPAITKVDQKTEFIAYQEENDK